MYDEFEYYGLWWFPDTPERKYYGKIEYTPVEGAILEFLGPVTEQEFDLLLGLTPDGKEITLYQCSLWGMESCSAGLTRYKIKPRYVLLGKHFDGINELVFEKFLIAYSSVNNWINIPVIQFELLETGEEAVKYAPKKPVEVVLADGDIISILTSLNVSGDKDGDSLVKIKQQVYFSLYTTPGKQLIYFDERVHWLMNLLSLAAMTPVYPLEILAYTDDRSVPIKLYYQRYSYPKNGLLKTRMPVEMLFTYEDVSETFSEIVISWFSKIDILEQFFNLYFATTYNRNIYLQNRFLLLAQAIETYHRRVMGGKYMGDDEYRKDVYPILVDAIPENLENSFNNSLKHALKFSHEYSLRKRLTELTAQFEPVFVKFEPDIGGFIEKVTDTRNWLTHYDEESKGKAVNGEELWYLTESLQALVEMCILYELGFGVDDIERLFTRFTKYAEKFGVKGYSFGDEKD